MKLYCVCWIFIAGFMASMASCTFVEKHDHNHETAVSDGHK